MWLLKVTDPDYDFFSMDPDGDFSTKNGSRLWFFKMSDPPIINISFNTEKKALYVRKRYTQYKRHNTIRKKDIHKYNIQTY